MNKISIFQKFIGEVVLKMLTNFNDANLRDVFAKVVKHRTMTLLAPDGLRFLFALEEILYSLQGELSVAYGGGIHTKHRQTGYHDFFINRIYPAENVLDVGCGIGVLAYTIAEKKAANVVGIDFSELNISIARRKYAHPRVRYVVGDVLQSLPVEHFNVVVLSNILEHLSDRINFLKKIQSTVKPSRFLVRVPLFERDWRVPLKYELGMEWRLDTTHEIEYTLESFTHEVRNSGLKAVYQEVRWGEIWAEIIPGQF